MRLHWSWGLAMVVAAFLACSDDDGASAPGDLDAGAAPEGSVADGDVDAAGPPTEKSACIAYVTAYCDKLVACTGNTTVKDACTQTTSLCPEYYFSPGTTRTVDGMIACADDIAKFPCDAFNAGLRPDCVKPGTLEAGAPCFSNAQCATSSCFGSAGGGACGACADTYPPDATCSYDGVNGPIVCERNERCNFATPRRCEAIVVPTVLAAGASCTGAANEACPKGMSCLTTSGDASASGPASCMALPTPGNPCARSPQVNMQGMCATGAYCKHPDAPSGDFSTGTCMANAQKDQPCGNFNPPTFVLCADGLYCKAGTCAPFEAIDATCDALDACGTTNYCLFDGPTGKCRPPAVPGEVCNTVLNDGGPPSSVPCSTKQCLPEGDGGYRCHLDPVGRDGDCSNPIASCYSVLTCSNGKCEPVDYAACVADASR